MGIQRHCPGLPTLSFSMESVLVMTISGTEATFAFTIVFTRRLEMLLCSSKRGVSERFQTTKVPS